MSEGLPVRGTILSSSPCTVKDASIILKKFIGSESVPDAGLLRGYLISVSEALEELVSRRAKGEDETMERRIPNFEGLTSLNVGARKREAPASQELILEPIVEHKRSSKKHGRSDIRSPQLVEPPIMEAEIQDSRLDTGDNAVSDISPDLLSRQAGEKKEDSSKKKRRR